MRTKEQKREYFREYRQQHKEQINAYYRTYYKQNREVIGLQRKVTSAKKSKEKVTNAKMRDFRPRAYYNRVFAWVITNGEVYLTESGVSTSLLNACFYEKREWAEEELTQEGLEHYQIIPIEIREKVGEQQVIGV